MSDEKKVLTVGGQFEIAVARYTTLLKSHPDMKGKRVGRFTTILKFEIISEDGSLKEHQVPLMIVEGFGQNEPQVFYLFS